MLHRVCCRQFCSGGGGVSAVSSGQCVCCGRDGLRGRVPGCNVLGARRRRVPSMQHRRLCAPRFHGVLPVLVRGGGVCRRLYEHVSPVRMRGVLPRRRHSLHAVLSRCVLRLRRVRLRGLPFRAGALLQHVHSVHTRPARARPSDGGHLRFVSRGGVLFCCRCGRLHSLFVLCRILLSRWRIIINRLRAVRPGDSIELPGRA